MPSLSARTVPFFTKSSIWHIVLRSMRSASSTKRMFPCPDAIRPFFRVLRPSLIAVSVSRHPKRSSSEMPAGTFTIFLPNRIPEDLAAVVLAEPALPRIRTVFIFGSTAARQPLQRHRARIWRKKSGSYLLKTFFEFRGIERRFFEGSSADPVGKYQRTVAAMSSLVAFFLPSSAALALVAFSIVMSACGRLFEMGCYQTIASRGCRRNDVISGLLGLFDFLLRSESSF